MPPIRFIRVIRGWFPGFPRIKRCFLGERFCRNFRGDAAVIAHAHHTVVCDAADLRPWHVPFVENLTDEVFFAVLGNNQHSLLRFAE